VIPWHPGAWLWPSCFGISILSALFPWINGEVVAFGYATLMHTPAEMAALALVVSAGQTVGKVFLYHVGFVAGKLTPRESARIERWRGRLTGRLRSALALVFMSSVTSIPPLYPTTLLAGAVRLPFPPFIGVVACGRVVRYFGLLLVPAVIVWLRR
jgi:membrane protein YqaA with SNARE-associated domain